MLTAEQATPAQLAALVRNHWQIEKRLRYVRDFTYDEDRYRVWAGELPRNLACLTNASISILRCQSRFRYVPEATATSRPARQSLWISCKPRRGASPARAPASLAVVRSCPAGGWSPR